nr:MAG TPA: hypothetical protein [Crassvirales sp.]
MVKLLWKLTFILSMRTLCFRAYDGIKQYTSQYSF